MYFITTKRMLEVCFFHHTPTFIIEPRFTYLYSYNKLSRRLPSLFAGIGVELTWKILFTENIVIIRAVTGICYRIFGVEAINIMELIHEGDEKVHI